MKKNLVTFLCSLLLLSGCTGTTDEAGTQQTDPNRKTLGSLSYSLGELKDVNVNITFENPEKLWTAEGLQAAAKECGTEQPIGHYQDLMKSFEKTTVQAYHFTPKNSPEEAYDVLLVPNRPGYSTLEEAKKDFDVCAAGGMYPLQVSKGYMLLTGSCGGAGTEERPAVSCSDLQTTVQPSLKLVE